MGEGENEMISVNLSENPPLLLSERRIGPLKKNETGKKEVSLQGFALPTFCYTSRRQISTARACVGCIREKRGRHPQRVETE